jgi:arylsulfatase A-like enzyme
MSDEEAFAYYVTAEVAAGETHRTAFKRDRVTDACTREVEYFDKWLARLIDRKKQEALWQNSIVVLWSDHGEQFWEHQGWEQGRTFYDEVLQVPLMIHMPGQTEGVTIEESVSLLDVMPTLLELCGLPVTEELRGNWFAPLLRRDEMNCRMRSTSSRGHTAEARGRVCSSGITS